jgi:hypothetical protein
MQGPFNETPNPSLHPYEMHGTPLGVGPCPWEACEACETCTCKACEACPWEACEACEALHDKQPQLGHTMDCPLRR